MIKIISQFLSLIFTLIDIPPLHLLIYTASSSGYVIDYVSTKGTHNVFRRLKKVATNYRRQ
jgi:hypothetical protein